MFELPSFESSKEDIYRAMSRVREEAMAVLKTCRDNERRAFHEMEISRAYFDAVPEPVLVLELGTFRILAANQAALNLYGYGRDEFLSLNIKDIRPRELVSRFMQNVALNLMPSREIISRHMKKNGEVIDVRIVTSDILLNGVACRLAQIHDITGKKKAEDALNFLNEAGIILASSLDYKSSLDRVLELTAKQFGGCVAVHLAVENDGLKLERVGHVNKPFAESFQHSLERLTLESDVCGPVHVFRTGRSECIPDLRVKFADEDYKQSAFVQLLNLYEFKSFMCVPIFARGRILGSITFQSKEQKFDNTFVALAEELARRLGLAVENARLYTEVREGLRLRDEFISIASHELKSPLAALRLHLQFIRHFFEKELNHSSIFDRSVKILSTADKQVEKATRLIQELLEVSRVRSNKISLELESVDLRELIEGVLERVSHEFRADPTRIRFGFEGIIVGTWDRLRVEQIVTNLMTNALKYGGQNPIDVNIWPEDSKVHISVRDYGIGISKEDQRRIFEKFERATDKSNKTSLGLGLYIARQLARKLEGDIKVESEIGHGSNFVVTLPYVSRQPSQLH